MVKDSCPFKGMLACLSWRVEIEASKSRILLEEKKTPESFISKENTEKYGSTTFSLSKKEEIVNFPCAANCLKTGHPFQNGSGSCYIIVATQLINKNIVIFFSFATKFLVK